MKTCVNCMHTVFILMLKHTFTLQRIIYVMVSKTKAWSIVEFGKTRKNAVAKSFTHYILSGKTEHDFCVIILSCFTCGLVNLHTPWTLCTLKTSYSTASLYYKKTSYCTDSLYYKNTLNSTASADLLWNNLTQQFLCRLTLKTIKLNSLFALFELFMKLDSSWSQWIYLNGFEILNKAPHHTWEILNIKQRINSYNVYIWETATFSCLTFSAFKLTLGNRTIFRWNNIMG